MSTPREGQRVAYVGDPLDGLAVGDQGKVLSSSETACHVLWSTGARTGSIHMVEAFDLVPARQAAASQYDGLDSGRLVSIAVRDVIDGQGVVGLLNAMNEEGHLSSLASIAEQAMTQVAAHLREDPSFREVLAQLDPDEGAEFVQFTATALLRDAFGGGEDS